MTGDACSVSCGYCGMCSGGHVVERTCIVCRDVFLEAVDGEYVVQAVCPTCQAAPRSTAIVQKRVS